ncbi:unnamed protein product [Dovyalis caffra]|uniref:Uncharacterized protein n=1 Tax=Dovyalis caffra TaxID=77055 RepID=A0AAV1S809_9ROSI|nr:unnamed protein product [Dovyalis caffra]
MEHQYCDNCQSPAGYHQRTVTVEVEVEAMIWNPGGPGRYQVGSAGSEILRIPTFELDAILTKGKQEQLIASGK